MCALLALSISQPPTHCTIELCKLDAKSSIILLAQCHLAATKGHTLREPPAQRFMTGCDIPHTEGCCAHPAPLQDPSPLLSSPVHAPRPQSPWSLSANAPPASKLTPHGVPVGVGNLRDSSWQQPFHCSTWDDSLPASSLRFSSSAFTFSCSTVVCLARYLPREPEARRCSILRA